MKKLFLFTGLVAVAMILWTVLGYLMDMPSFPLVFLLTIGSVVLFFLAGLLKNREEKRKFEAFLDSMKQDKDLQKKMKDERIDPGDKTGRARIKAYYKDRNIGLSWTGASVHGAVPKRNKRRSFLPKNR